MPPADNRGNRLALTLLISGLGVGLAARLFFAFHDDGLLWPDEYYQSLEPAHRAVFGYGWQAWEFLAGARHWTLPAFVAALMKLSESLGLDYLATIEVTFCLAATITGFAIYRLARAQAASPFSAAIASSVFALMGLAVYIAPRATGENLSGLPVTLAFALLFRSGGVRMAIAALLLTVAVGLRLQNGFFCLGAVALLLAKQRRADAGLLFGFLLIGALLYGAIDQLTWGSFFHSARQYLVFNVLEGRASQYGTASVFHYLGALITAEGLTIIPLVALTALGMRTRSEIALVALGFFVLHSLIPHKELRFLFPIIPLLCAQAALGLDQLRVHRDRAAIGVVVLSLASLATLPTLTFWRLGIWNPRGALSAIDYAGPENRLLRSARTLTDLCGLKIASIEHWRTGGYAYLHQRVPMYRFQPPEAGEGHYNYVIAQRGSWPGTEVAVDGERALIKLSTACTPDLTYDWHLE